VKITAGASRDGNIGRSTKTLLKDKMGLKREKKTRKASLKRTSLTREEK